MLLTASLSSCRNTSERLQQESSKSAKDSAVKAEEDYQKDLVFNKDKPYPFETGILEYEYKGDRKGRQTVYIRDYGRTSRVEDEFEKITPLSYKSYQVFISNPEKMYVIDMLQNNGYYIRQGDTSMNIQGNLLTDISRMGIDSTMRKNGYKRTGKDIVNHMTCQIYKGSSSRFCFANGYNIRTEMNYGSEKYTLELINKQENVSIPDDKFQPPADVKLTTWEAYVKNQTRGKL
jgi:hypothetical protein